jgi:hypothetical protein
LESTKGRTVIGDGAFLSARILVRLGGLLMGAIHRISGVVTSIYCRK